MVGSEVEAKGDPLCPAGDSAEQPSALGPYGANVEDSVCCRNYVRHRLPLHVVKHHYWTSDNCRRPGVV